MGAKKMAIIAAGVIVLGSIVYFGFLSGGSSASAEPLANKPASAKVSNKVVAQAKVLPQQSAALSIRTAGTVAAVAVSEGDTVAAGQVLVRLASDQQAAAVAQAAANVKRAQARLGELKAGARSQEIASAEASVAAAQAEFLRVQSGADETQIITAKAEAANAEAALRQAQADYDRAGGVLAAGIGASPVSLRLEQSTNNFQAAQARLTYLMSMPRPSDLAVAKAEVQRAQSQLDLLRAGARNEAIMVAEADVDSAEAALAQARAALADTELRAPFAGVVAAMDARQGEQVSPAAAIVRLANMSNLELETTDLTEVQVVRVKVGDAVVVTVDALPGLEIPATVSRIRSLGETRQGDIVYRVTVKPGQLDARMRWNMTALVTIEAK